MPDLRSPRTAYDALNNFEPALNDTVSVVIAVGVFEKGMYAIYVRVNRC